VSSLLYLLLVAAAAAGMLLARGTSDDELSQGNQSYHAALMANKGVFSRNFLVSGTVVFFLFDNYCSIMD
jgi:hypothetical protein